MQEWKRSAKAESGCGDGAPSPWTTSKELNRRIIDGKCHDPFAVLGRHPVTGEEDGDKFVVVRCLVPYAREVEVLTVRGRWRGLQRWEQGDLFAAVFAAGDVPMHPRIRAAWEEGAETKRQEWIDSYSFLPLLSEYDRHLFNEGSHHRIYEKMGAHLETVDEIEGVVFRVWAPNARRVSVVGDFNFWSGRRHMMRSLGSSGIWEIFVPGLQQGDLYKFELLGADDRVHLKSDPFAFFAEMRPKTASQVWSLERYLWRDDQWMASRRDHQDYDRPMAIYEVHLGSWRRPADASRPFLTYREIAEQLAPYVKDLGFTHIELLPVMAHPLDASWGYQVSGYYAPTTRFGSPDDFKAFVDTCHQHDIGVILDWVPAHFPKDEHALARFDGTCLYEHEDPRKGEHPDWGTLIFNYGRNEVRNFLTANALFWLDQYHIDALRVDAVASMLYLDYSRPEGMWVPNEFGGRENLDAIAFLREFNELVYRYHPDCFTVAEESTAWPMVSRPTYLGGLGFGYKWNMGWMHDMLAYFGEDCVFRKYHHSKLTFSLLYAFHENFILPISHDEVVHGKGSLLAKMPGDRWRRFANLRLFLAYMYAHPGKKLLFMGTELAQEDEWNHEGELPWSLLEKVEHQQVLGFMKDLNRLYRSQQPLWEVDFDPAGFQWVDFRDSDQSIVSFLRRGKDPDDFLFFVFNFTPVVRRDYRLGVPRGGFYREIFNTDSRFYGGSDVGNGGGVAARPGAYGEWPCSLTLTLPPLAALVLKPEQTSV